MGIVAEEGRLHLAHCAITCLKNEPGVSLRGRVEAVMLGNIMGGNEIGVLLAGNGIAARMIGNRVTPIFRQLTLF